MPSTTRSLSETRTSCARWAELAASAHVKITLGVEYGRIVHLIAMDRGRLMDEYVSVPSSRNVAPGDATLRANPTVLSRLTGADPGRIRSVARWPAESPDELPPAEDLIADVAAARHRRRRAAVRPGAELPGAVVVEHE